MTEKIMEARRARFEEWYSAVSCLLEDDWFKIDSNGFYFSDATSDAWECWNAALDSLCVELPSIYEIAWHEEDGDGSWKAMPADRVIEAIHAAGVKTK